MIKKISILSTLFLFAPHIFAVSKEITETIPTGVVLEARPQASLWSFGITGLWAAPTNDDFQYAQTLNEATPISEYFDKNIEGDHQAGIILDATYYFQNSGSDAKVALTHIDMDTVNNPSLYGLAVIDPFGVSSGLANSAYVEVDNDINALDLVFGETISVGKRLRLHPFAGVRYADIENDSFAQYYQVTTMDNRLGSGRITSSYNGIGPRAGMDISASLIRDLSLVGSIATSILIGNLDTTVTELVYLENPVVYNNTDVRYVNPEFDAQLGVNYRYIFNSANSIDLTLGYQIVNYFNAIDSNFIDVSTPNNVNQCSNVGYQGPYLRLQLNLS